MRKYTHLIFAFLLFLLLNIILKYSIYLALFALVGALIPDLDLKFGKLHRKLFHNIWFLGFLIFLGLHFKIINQTIAIIISIGFISHLIIDSFTPSGIMFLWPIKQPKIKGPVKTGSLNEYSVVIILLLIIGIISGLL